ncbi:MAG: tetratricopeptide repeat protein [Prevotellaceae bacterium]|jgi:hypothetical protein|nr:tetratricopeptide repeat protein [Prevotellaceae bacterium]
MDFLKDNKKATIIIIVVLLAGFGWLYYKLKPEETKTTPTPPKGDE